MQSHQLFKSFTLAYTNDLCYNAIITQVSAHASNFINLDQIPDYDDPG